MKIAENKLRALLDEGAVLTYAVIEHPTKGHGTISAFGRVCWDDPKLQHTCSYYCERPECIRQQREELRDLMFSEESKIVFATRNGVVRTAVGDCEPNMQYKLIPMGTHL